MYAAVQAWWRQACRLRSLYVALVMLLLAGTAWAEERFPPPEFRGGYKIPTEQQPLPRASKAIQESLGISGDMFWSWVDVGVLAAALGLAVYFVHVKRTRWGVFGLTIFSLAYFGFYREGCVCAVGSIQNVAAAAFNPYALPWTVAAFFGLPLIVAIFAGRVFCAGVCPLGVIQDVFLFKPVQVPSWVEASLGLFAHFYLGLAVVLAATGTDFIICSYDPFVPMYRMSGTSGMLLIGAALLVASMFVGRVYCRFICPYSVLLRGISRLAQWKVHVSPKECIDCRLCETSCPFGALKHPVREPASRQQARQRLLIGIGVTAFLLALLPLTGWKWGPMLGRMDRTVQLAEQVNREENDAKIKRTDESKAWRLTGEPAQDLIQRATNVQWKLGLGGAILGLWMAIAVGNRLIRWSLPSKQTIYDADAAGCVACARCFEYCPVELQRRGTLVPLTVSAQPAAKELAGVSA